MLRTHVNRKRYSKREIDRAVHQAIGSTGNGRAIKGALVHLIDQVRARSELLRPDTVGGRCGWTRAVRFTHGMAAAARYHARWLNDASSWTPTEESRSKQFASLVRHLLAAHPVPHFMASVWFEGLSPKARLHRTWFRHVGLGHSIRGADIPIGLTKTMAVLFAHAPDHFNVEQALRWTHVRGLGGDRKLAIAIAQTRLGGCFEHEPYWSQVIRLLVGHSRLKTENIEPLIDYLHFHRRLYQAEPTTSIGRANICSLVRKALRWVATAESRSRTPRRSWSGLGLGTFRYHEEAPAEWTSRSWAIRELTDSRELAAEGRALRHCVGSYDRRCAARQSSIWSLTCTDTIGRNRRMLTIEIDPATRTVVTALGKGNSNPTVEARRILLKWAARERLNVSKWI